MNYLYAIALDVEPTQAFEHRFDATEVKHTVEYSEVITCQHLLKAHLFRMQWAAVKITACTRIFTRDAGKSEFIGHKFTIGPETEILDSTISIAHIEFCLSTTEQGLFGSKRMVEHVHIANTCNLISVFEILINREKPDTILLTSTPYIDAVIKARKLTTPVRATSIINNIICGGDCITNIILREGRTGIDGITTS